MTNSMTLHARLHVDIIVGCTIIALDYNYYKRSYLKSPEKRPLPPPPGLLPPSFSFLDFLPPRRFLSSSFDDVMTPPSLNDEPRDVLPVLLVRSLLSSSTASLLPAAVEVAAAIVWRHVCAAGARRRMVRVRTEAQSRKYRKKVKANISRMTFDDDF